MEGRSYLAYQSSISINSTRRKLGPLSYDCLLLANELPIASGILDESKYCI